MKKIIFGIFAHPDDEAMGPSGTLLLETKAGSELHLITLTNGNAGTNPDNIENLGKVRIEEWRKAGNMLGASSMYHLGYDDGHLDNFTMIDASKKLIDIIQPVLAANTDAEVEFITLDLNGLTGHIDHIVAARTACFVFYTLKKDNPQLSRIRLFCLTAKKHPMLNTDWLYMEQGHSTHEVSETIDATHLNDELQDIIRVHFTQRSDGENVIASLGDTLGYNNFIVKY
jgi:N-acetylglucosamine malate deacetylase 2